MMTYDDCKALLATAKDPAEGKPINGSRKWRLHRKANGDFVIHRRSYGGYSYPVLTIRANGTYTTPFSRQGRYLTSDHHEAARLFATTRLVAPDAPPPPPIPAEVKAPFYVSQDDPHRSRYDAALAANGGSLEEWHQRRYAYERDLDHYHELAAQWEDTHWVKGVFAGAVFGADGRLTEASYAQYQRAVRVDQRRRARQRREGEKRQRDYDRKLEQQKKARARAQKDSKIPGSVGARTADWLIRNGIKPNADGTVPLIKLVKDDYQGQYRGPHDIVYTPGAEVVAPDYQGHNGCGQGLHFSPTIADAARHLWQGSTDWTKAILCHVDLETLIPISEAKVKARSCKVIGELPVDLAVDQTQTAASIADKMAKAALAAVKGATA